MRGTVGLFLLVLLGSCATRRPWREARNETAALAVNPEEGVANLHLGMAPAAVARRLGPPAQKDEFPDGSAYWTWPELGLSVAFEGGGVKTIFLFSGVKGGYETRDYRPFPGRIPLGGGELGLDATRADVERLLGPAATTESMTDAPLPAVWAAWPGGLAFCFLSSTQQIIYISLNAR